MIDTQLITNNNWNLINVTDANSMLNWINNLMVQESFEFITLITIPRLFCIIAPSVKWFLNVQIFYYIMNPQFTKDKYLKDHSL